MSLSSTLHQPAQRRCLLRPRPAHSPPPTLSLSLPPGSPCSVLELEAACTSPLLTVRLWQREQPMVAGEFFTFPDAAERAMDYMRQELQKVGSQQPVAVVTETDAQTAVMECVTETAPAVGATTADGRQLVRLVSLASDSE